MEQLMILDKLWLISFIGAMVVMSLGSKTSLFTRTPTVIYLSGFFEIAWIVFSFYLVFLHLFDWTWDITLPNDILPSIDEVSFKSLLWNQVSRLILIFTGIVVLFIVSAVIEDYIHPTIDGVIDDVFKVVVAGVFLETALLVIVLVAIGINFTVSLLFNSPALG